LEGSAYGGSEPAEGVHPKGCTDGSPSRNRARPFRDVARRSNQAGKDTVLTEGRITEAFNVMPHGIGKCQEQPVMGHMLVLE
jgi:hypothetical protein